MSRQGEAFAIRWAAPSDQKRLEQLLSSVPEVELNELEGLVSLLQDRLAKREILVAVLGGEILGTAALVGGALEGPFVEPHWRGRGISRALIDEATHEARRRGLALIVRSDWGSSGFYRRCGFAPEAETETPDGAVLTMSR